MSTALLLNSPKELIVKIETVPAVGLPMATLLAEGVMETPRPNPLPPILLPCSLLLTTLPIFKMRTAKVDCVAKLQTLKPLLAIEIAIFFSNASS